MIELSVGSEIRFMRLELLKMPEIEIRAWTLARIREA